MISPKVSVIIPTYNRREYVQETIDSVLAQTYTDYEIIVIDDGSTDGTGEALQSRYGDRIHYEWQENQGESVARNRGIELARGEYIAFLDSDDLWLPEKLEKQIAFLQKATDVGMVCCAIWLVDEKDQKFRADSVESCSENNDISLEMLLSRNHVSGPSTVVLHGAIVQRVGGFDPQIRFGEDWDFWIRVAGNSRIVALPEPLALIRRHSGTQCYYPSLQKNGQRLADHLRILEKAFKTYPCMITPEQQRYIKGTYYLQAFVADMAVDAPDTAFEHLRVAYTLDSSLLTDEVVFTPLIVNQSVMFAENILPQGLTHGIEYGKRVLAQLHKVGVRSSRFERKVMAHINATLGFIAYEHLGPQVARPFFLHALWLDFTWWHNRGLLSILTQSFIGEKLKDEISQWVFSRRGNNV